MKISIKVIPKSSPERVLTKDGTIKVYVSAAPDKGKANKAVVSLLAKTYKVAKSKVVIISGETSKNKIVEVQNK